MMPTQNPTAAGIKLPPDRSSEGIMRLHTEAAIMTPAANPFRHLTSKPPVLFLKKKTRAAPREVPINGIARTFKSEKDISV